AVSVDVALIASGLRQLLELAAAGVFITLCRLGENFDEHGIDVLRHALFIAADVNMRAILYPAREFGATLPQAMLNIDLFRLVARERNIDLREIARFQVILPLELVEKIIGEVALAEKQPALALRSRRNTLLDKGAIGSNARTG